MDHTRLSNSQFKVLLDDIFAKADGNAAEFFLTQDLLDGIKSERDLIVVDIADQTAKRAEARAATTKLSQRRTSGNTKVSLLKRAMKASATFTPDKYVALGFDADDLTPSLISPQTPLELSVTGASNGVNSLKYNRNGNKQGTIFLIEAKIGDAAQFAIVGTTTKSFYDHEGQTPGVKIIYRIRAQRGDDFSQYSNEAIVYG